MKGIFKLNWTNIWSAIVYALVSMAVAFVMTVAENLLKLGTIFGVNWLHLVDLGSMAAIGAFVATTSLVKNLLTTDKGNFLGVVPVIPRKDY